MERKGSEKGELWKRKMESDIREVVFVGCGPAEAEREAVHR